MKAANYLYAVAPKDGSVFGTFGRGLAMEPLIGTSATRFDARTFVWLGSGSNEYSVFVLRRDAPVKTWADMLTTPFTVAGEGSGSDPDIYAAVLKNGFGVRLKLITGYPGTAEMALAIDRGEVDGRASWSWSSLKELKPEWLSNKEVNLPVQMNLTKNPELPECADGHGFRQDRSGAADSQYGDQPTDHGPAFRGAARDTAGPCRGVARRLRCDDDRQGFLE